MHLVHLILVVLTAHGCQGEENAVQVWLDTLLDWSVQWHHGVKSLLHAVFPRAMAFVDNPRYYTKQNFPKLYPLVYKLTHDWSDLRYAFKQRAPKISSALYKLRIFLMRPLYVIAAVFYALYYVLRM